MKTQLLTLGLLIGGCGSMDHLATSIDNATKKTNTDTNSDTATAANTKTGSKTVSTSTTTTISESGDQSVFESDSVGNGVVQKDAVVKGVQKTVVDSPIVGTWLEACDDGIAYKKVFGADGVLTVTTYVFDNQVCDGSEIPPQVFVQKRKYQVAQDMVQIGNDAPITINVSGDNNTVIIGNQELQKH